MENRTSVPFDFSIVLSQENQYDINNFQHC